MNPILLRLMYEYGGKVPEDDIYDKCLKEFVRLYYQSNSHIMRQKEKDSTISDVPKEINPIGDKEWRTWQKCLEDFTACMKYLNMQGYKRKKLVFTKKIQQKLKLVQEDIGKHADPVLYQEFVEIMNNC